MKTVDKRIQKTRASLKEALTRLVIERGYEDITIQDVTTEAGIGYRPNTIIGIVVAIILNFIGYNRYVFRTLPQKPGS